jgi:hypothetical protein
MNIRAFALSLVLACGFLAAPAYADDAQGTVNSTTVSVDLTKLDPNARNAVIDAVKAAEAPATAVAQPPVSADTAKQWADVGKNIGSAIAETCKALSIGVNDFIKTPAGILTIAVLILYLFGASLWAVVGGTIAWIVLGSLIWASFRKFHMPQKLKDKDGNEHFETYDFHSDDARTVSAVVHACAFVLLTIVMLIIVL